MAVHGSRKSTPRLAGEQCLRIPRIVIAKIA
jgi:hypothetical protein